MAVIWRHDFTGSSGTNGSAATPTVGSALSFNFGTESTLDGSGQLVAGDAYYDIPTGSMGDATIKVRWTPPAIFTGDLLLFFRADAASGVPFNTDATALFMQGGQTIALQDRGPANSNDGTLATAGTAVSGTPIDIWIRLDGARCRVWFDANTGTPDLDTSAMSRTTGHAGLRIVGAGAAIDYIEFDDVASSPGGGAVDEIIAPATMDAAPAWWARELATWQQHVGQVFAPLAAGVAAAPDQIVVDDEAWTAAGAWWATQLAAWQQLTAATVAPLADDVVEAGAVLAADVAVTVSTTADLSVAKDLLAELAIAVLTSGDLSVAKPLACALGIGVTVSAALSVPKPLSADVALGVTTAADLTVSGAGAALASALAVSVSTSADLAIAKPLAASVGVAVTTSGALAVPKPLAAALSTAVTTTAALEVAKPLAAAVAVAVATAANLTAPGAGNALAADVGISVAATAALAVPKPLACAVVVSVTTTGDLLVAKPLNAALALAVSTGATLTVPKPLSAAVSVTVAAQGTFQGLAAQLAAGVAITVTVGATLGGGGVSRVIGALRGNVRTAHLAGRVQAAAPLACHVRTASAVRGRPRLTGGS